MALIRGPLLVMDAPLGVLRPIVNQSAFYGWTRSVRDFYAAYRECGAKYCFRMRAARLLSSIFMLSKFTAVFANVYRVAVYRHGFIMHCKYAVAAGRGHFIIGFIYICCLVVVSFFLRETRYFTSRLGLDYSVCLTKASIIHSH